MSMVSKVSKFSKLQQRLGSLSTAPVESDPVQVNCRSGSEPSFAGAVQNARTPAWDPHEVWLNRVKKPRDQRSAD